MVPSDAEKRDLSFEKGPRASGRDPRGKKLKKLWKVGSLVGKKTKKFDEIGQIWVSGALDKCK